WCGALHDTGDNLPHPCGSDRLVGVRPFHLHRAAGLRLGLRELMALRVAKSTLTRLRVCVPRRMSPLASRFHWATLQRLSLRGSIHPSTPSGTIRRNRGTFSLTRPAGSVQ